jgi:hypothetical protein
LQDTTSNKSACRVPQKKVTVQNIYVKTGSPEYINSYLNTSWKYLDKSLEKLISSDEGFYNTRKILLDCKTKCFHEMDKYDLSDIYAFEAIHSFSVVSKHGTFPVMYDNLVWKPEHLNILRDHCKVRSSFLRRLHELKSPNTYSNNYSGINRNIPAKDNFVGRENCQYIPVYSRNPCENGAAAYQFHVINQLKWNTNVCRAGMMAIKPHVGLFPGR